MSHLHPAGFAGVSGLIRRGRGAYRILALLSLFAMVCGGIVMAPTSARASDISMTTSDVNLRTGPSTDYSIILAIPPATPVTITGDPENGYYPIEYNGIDGYAYGDYIVFGSDDPNIDGGAPSATGDAWVVDGSLNLRSGPSLEDSVITVMPGDAQVTLTGTLNNGYFSVNYQGTDGWAFALYLSTNGPSDTSTTGPSDNSDSSSTDNGNVGSGPTGTGWVIDGALNLRAGPDTDTDVLTVMPGDAQVTLTGQSSNGFDSVNYNGTDGWAYDAYLSQTAPSSGETNTGSNSGSNSESGNATSSPATSSPATSSPTGTAWVVDGALNLRSGPDNGNSVIMVMSDGSQVTLTGQASNGYLSVNFQGTDGWAWGDFLSTTQPSSSSGTASSGTSTASTNSSSDITSIIYAAADKYGQPREDMLRVAQCESVLDPNAVNPVSGASGLFQFLPSTWAQTPYANQSIFDPTANANAAAWMWSVGRRNEWTCQ